MKRINKGAEPQSLSLFRGSNPTANWDRCKQNPTRHLEIKSQIYHDQSGLCAYCEIDLRLEQQNSQADFRVEHFHPKSDGGTGKNWHLDWDNLLGCCHGGSQTSVLGRHTRDHSCDVPKGDKNLDGIILNPLLLPKDCLFSFSRSHGAITIKETTCQQTGVNVNMAERTIQELQLDGSRLRTLRRATLNSVANKVYQLSASGVAIEEVRRQLARELLKKDANGCWPPFFSAIRSYLGKAAEEYLTEEGYIG